jgi:hypothetical protein
MRKELTVDPKWEEKRKKLPGSDFLSFVGPSCWLGFVYFTDRVLDEIGKLNKAYETCIDGISRERRSVCDHLRWSAWVKGDELESHTFAFR